MEHIVGVLFVLFLLGGMNKGKATQKSTYGNGTPIGPAFWKGCVKLRLKWKSEEDIIMIFSLLLVVFMSYGISGTNGEDATLVVLLFGFPFLLAAFLMFWHTHIEILPRVALHPRYKYSKPFTPGEEESKKLTKLYRKLARRYHPDLAQTLPQKVYFEHMMKKINNAYSNRDFKTLLVISQEYNG